MTQQFFPELLSHGEGYVYYGGVHPLRSSRAKDVYEALKAAQYQESEDFIFGPTGQGLPSLDKNSFSIEVRHDVTELTRPFAVRIGTLLDRDNSLPPYYQKLRGKEVLKLAVARKASNSSKLSLEAVVARGMEQLSVYHEIVCPPES